MSKTNIQVQLSGEDGNIFSILGRTTQALRRGGYPELVNEVREKVHNSNSYDEALQVIMSYVDVL